MLDNLFTLFYMLFSCLNTLWGEQRILKYYIKYYILFILCIRVYIKYKLFIYIYFTGYNYLYKDKKNKPNQSLNHKCLKLWTNQNTKLNQIKNNIQIWHNPTLMRKEETILNRLRTGHTFITHKQLMVKMWNVWSGLHSQTHYHWMPKIRGRQKKKQHITANRRSTRTWSSNNQQPPTIP